MKKHILLTLAAAGLFLAACGEQPAQSSSPTPTPSSESSIVPASSSETPASSSETPASSSSSSETPSSSSSEAATITGVTVAVDSGYEAVIAPAGNTALTATVTGTGAFSREVTWKSSDASIATVDQEGVVTGVAVGKATITATAVGDTSKTGTIEIEVNDRIGVTALADVIKLADKAEFTTRAIVAGIPTETYDYQTVAEYKYVYVADGGTFFQGFNVHASDLTGIAVGDTVEIKGVVSQYGSKSEHWKTPEFSSKGFKKVTDTQVKAPVFKTWDAEHALGTITEADINKGYEISKATVTSISTSSSGHTTIKVSLGTEKATIYLHKDTKDNTGDEFAKIKVGSFISGKTFVGVNYDQNGFQFVGLTNLAVEQPAVLESISFAEASANIDQNEYKKFEPIANPAGAKIGELLWSSSAEAVATVDAKGVVHGLTEGSAVITATLKSDANIKASITINVSDKEVVEEYTALKDVKDDTAYKVRGVITAKTAEYVYIDDGTDVAAIKASGDQYVIDKEMVIDGTTKFYYGEKQFIDDSIATVREDKKISGTTLANPLTLTSEDLVKLKDKGNISSQAVTFTAAAVQNDSHVNWKIGDLFLNYANKSSTMPALVVGANYTVTGYVRSYNTKDNYFGVVAASVQQVYDNLESIAIDQGASTSVTVGEKKTLTVTPTPATADGSVTWESADKTKVTVTEAGQIEGIAVTTEPVNVTATSKVDGTKSAVIAVTVTEASDAYHYSITTNDHNAASGNNGYGDWNSVTDGDVVWSGNANMKPGAQDGNNSWRIGGKKVTDDTTGVTTTNYDRVLSTTSQLEDDIQTVKLDFGAFYECTVNSITVEVYKDYDSTAHTFSTLLASYQKDATEIASECSLTFTKQGTTDTKGGYLKMTFNVTVNATKNRFVRLSVITLDAAAE